MANSTAEETQRKLEKVQQQIISKQDKLDKSHSKLKQTQTQLAQTDRQIGQASRVLRQTKQELRQTQKQLKKLSARQQELEQLKQQQLQVLEKQLNSAYHIGQHDYLKVLLNQDSPAKLERVISYYQYLNKARTQAIENLKATLAELNQTTQTLNQKQLRLTELLEIEAQKQQELVSLKRQQQQQIDALAKLIKSESAEIERLRDNEIALSQALEALAEAIDELPQQVELNGLQDIKGRLLWPAKGRIQNIYGKRKSGQLRWKGVKIDADTGDTVHNVHAGQVVFSDWLKGYGLVIVVEHGDGFMTLYGHNQALLKDVGDIVQSGEPIALVGQSGGQSKPGLYFEVRYQGQPLNPMDWCN
ncbi:murein hydrolase activator EnvC family protein [Catenovulum agarivorans]|uniref:murein hydrolase activator EnvC family protein n=1 Tax=Catenovulum agarivorans TaxID=1172192 RepID=UPI0004B30B9B|nr:peptidoglycan DD-metalloendopeptidase family protein [Catenovulum agarivorans]